MKFSKALLSCAALMLLVGCGSGGGSSSSVAPSSPSSEVPSSTSSEITYYTITLDLNYEDAPVISPVTVAAGETAEVPDDPSREGYSFGGWYTTAPCVNLFNWEKVISHDYTVYASWLTVQDWSLVGSMNGWNPLDDTYMFSSDDAVNYYYEGFKVVDGAAFKIVKDFAWATQLAYAEVNTEDSDMDYVTSSADGNIVAKVAEGAVGAEYNITFDVTVKNSLTIKYVGTYTPEIEKYSFNLLGGFNSWAPQDKDSEAPYAMVPEGDSALTGTWVTTIDIAGTEEAPVEMKVIYFNWISGAIDGGANWCGASHLGDTHPACFGGTDNITCSGTGTYKFTVTVTDAVTDFVLSVVEVI